MSTRQQAHGGNTHHAVRGRGKQYWVLRILIGRMVRAGARTEA